MNENQFKFEKALEYEKNNQILHAIQIYNSLINDFGFKRSALIRLVTIYEKLNKIKAAIELIQKFTSTHPYDSEIIIFFGHFLIKYSFYHDALVCLRNMDTKKYPEVFYLRGIANYKLNDLETAIWNLSQILDNSQLAELIFEANIHLAKSFLKLGDIDKAEELVRNSKRLNPENFESYLVDAKISYRRAMFFHAYELIRKADIINPNDPAVTLWMGKILFKMEEYRKAEKCFRRYLDMDSRSSEAFSLLGWTCLNNDKFNEAEDYFARALIIDPKDELARQGIKKCSIV